MDVTLHELHLAFLLHKVAQDSDYPNYTLVQDESTEHRRCLVKGFGTWCVINGPDVRSFDDEERTRSSFNQHL